VRAVAVLLVICEHTQLIHNGFMGVDLFFVLSGFLITTLLCEEWERVGRISLRGFYARRARRLLPALGGLVLLAVGVDLLVYPLTGWGLGPKLISTFAFINNWVAGLGNSQDLGALNPTWSLAQEEQFYLLWPLALILLLHLRFTPGQILGLLVAVIAALLVFEPAMAAHLTGYSDYYSPIDRAAELLMGCGTSLVWRHRMVALPTATPEACRGPCRRAGVELAALAFAFAFAWLLIRTDPIDPRWVFLGAAGITVPLLVLLIQVPGTLLGRALACAPLRAVGRVSYGLYLIHLLIRNLMMHLFPGMTAELEVAALTLGVSLALATLSYRYIEAPIRSGRLPAPLARLSGVFRGSGQTADERRTGHVSQPTRSPIRSSA
jgi:peptidoglycan/LPS O-acetylase OafA/YrhL